MTQHDRSDLPEYSRTLLAIRSLRRWTQDQLAEALCVSRRTIVRWETGQGRGPNVRDMPMLYAMLKTAQREPQWRITTNILTGSLSTV